ncbi:uncharacterized protein LOC111802521 [Cucurbita pepo subsp. pepo]|uniref:uncharacterized protein LOC111802521 n=1 Tax=Cucurbita pepo subsp. pepo TaxID=3664 RepID=UPI000C9D4CA6|nr:uncharacterized protein LOC111802521 [Cucurbita pepo subsp. pepo]
MVRGIISPPRSRSSPRESRPFNNNGATNPPSRPNYMSPRRRPTTPINANELRTHRKEPQPTVVKRPTKPTDRSSNPPRIDPSRPNSKLVPSRPAAPSPNERKLDTKTAPKTTTRFSSPRPTKPITPPPSKSNGKGASGSGSRSDFSRAKPSDSQKGTPKNLRSGRLNDQQDEQIVRSYSDGSYGARTLSDPDVHKLHQLSLDDKDLANIVLHANLVYESLASETKEEECSSQGNNSSRMFQIYKEIASHHQGNSSITSYITKLKALWDELEAYIDIPKCSCGSTQKQSEEIEREKVMQFLIGLDDSYSTICAQILHMKPFPTVEKACCAILREEKRRELVLSLEIVAAKVIQNNWLLQNGHSINGDNEEVDHMNLQELKADQNEAMSVPIEPLLIDLGSPVRC